MVKAKLMLVVGPGGGRMDFVAGWLSLLPNFVNVNWGIDPVTHQSYGDMRFAKELDYGKNFESVWPRQFQLSADTDLYLVGTGHGSSLDQLQDKINSKSAKVVSINTAGPRINGNKIKWEFIVKTYLSYYKISYYQAVKRSKWLIDETIDKLPEHVIDKDRIAAVDALLKTPVGNSYKYQNQSPSVTEVDYDQLFCPGGSRHLCERLEMPVDDAYHQHWNFIVPLADAPKELTIWGHTWRYEDYFTD